MSIAVFSSYQECNIFKSYPVNDFIISNFIQYFILLCRDVLAVSVLREYCCAIAVSFYTVNISIWLNGLLTCDVKT